jgi:hypothetical protein
LHRGTGAALDGCYPLIGEQADDLELHIPISVRVGRVQPEIPIHGAEKLQGRGRRRPTLEVHVVVNRPGLGEVEAVCGQVA